MAKKKASGFEITGMAKYVNEGRKAGAKGIPIDALVSWIKSRKINTDGMKEGQMAFMFQSSIKRNGIPGSFFIDNALDNKAQEIEQAIDDCWLGSGGHLYRSYV